MLLIRNGRVITPMRAIDGGAVLVEGGTIQYVGPQEAITAPAGAEVIDAGGAFVSPGFIETHLHGGGGGDVMGATPSDIITCAQAHARGGVTAMLPSTLAAPMEAIVRALEAIETVQSMEYTGATIVGAHLEGPYFNLAQAGAQNPEYIKHPSLEEFGPILDRFPFIRRVSAAPELPGALELGQELRRRGIVASIAHSDGTFDDVIKAVENGYTHATHMFSGMSGVRRINAYRISGIIEAVLAIDELTTELIADGHHLPPSLMKLVLKAKGLNQVCVTTDAMAAAGLKPGPYELFGLKVVVEDDVAPEFEVKRRPGNYVAKLADRTAFASSVATMDQAVRTMTELVGLSVIDAVKMATLIPARIHGMAHERGMLSSGLAGDITIFDDHIQVQKTIVSGKVVFSRS